MNLKQLIRDLCKKDNLKELVRTHSIQHWMSLGFEAQNRTTIDKNMFDIIGSHGLLFYINEVGRRNFVFVDFVQSENFMNRVGV